MCHPPYDCSDGESDCSEYDAASDLETDRLNLIEQLRNANQKIPRKLRTHNLLLTSDYCDHWGRVEGIREIVQNFLDGICTAFDTTMDRVTFQHKVNGGPGKSRWTEAWIALSKNREDEEFGRITYNRKNAALIVNNENVTLSERVLLYGKSNKRKRRHLIGGYGEGMKIGILRLIVEGSGVRYRTGGQIWKFFMKQPRSVLDETLHYRTTDSKAKQRGNLEVLITNIEEEDFVLENFLALSRKHQFPVHENNWTPGHLIESNSRKELASERIYIKGLFVNSNPNLRVSVNFTEAEVTRDRNIKMVDENFRKHLASIWARVLENEVSLPVGDQKFTKKFLSFAKNDTSSVEFQCMEYMDGGAAKCLYYLILKQTPDAFPYKRGAEEEARLISQSLKKTPYPVPEEFLSLLMKRPQVMSVYKAQERAFLSDAAASSSFVYELPLARMMMAYVLKIIGADRITVKFHRPAMTGMDALLKDDVLICSEDLVQVDYEEEDQAVAAKLDIITCVERELQKGNDEAKVRKISLQTMRFVASAEFRSYLCPPLLSPSHSLSTPESHEGDKDERQHNHEETGEGNTNVGSKRPFHGEENSEPDDEHPTARRGAPKSRTKRTKVLPANGKRTMALDKVRSGLPAPERRAVTLRKASQLEVNVNAAPEDPMKTPNAPQAQARPVGPETPVVNPQGQNRNKPEGAPASRPESVVNNPTGRGPDEIAGRSTPNTPASQPATSRHVTTVTGHGQDQNGDRGAVQLTQGREANPAPATFTTRRTPDSPAILETSQTPPVHDQNEVLRDAGHHILPPTEANQGSRATALPHRMRIILAESALELTHKLSPQTNFAIVQSFEQPNANGSQVTTMNLGMVFPACRTKDGDILISVRVKQKIRDTDNTRHGQQRNSGHDDIDHQVVAAQNTGRQNEMPLHHRMRFSTEEFTFDLTYKLCLAAELSIVQNFTHAYTGDGQITTINLGTIFPSCRTEDGDVTVSVHVRKNSVPEHDNLCLS